MAAILRAAIVVCLTGSALLAQPADRQTLQSLVDRFESRDVNGRRVAVADMRGRVVLIDFWATWCAPCLAEIPNLREAQKRFGDRFSVIGVSVDVQDRASFISWLRRQLITWPQIFDGRGWTSPTVAPFELKGVPFNVLIGTDGRIIGVGVKGKQLIATLEVLIPTKAQEHSGR